MNDLTSQSSMKRRRQSAESIGLGIALGVALGAALGNVTLGLVIGLLCGSVGAIFRIKRF